ncbi:MAG: hypothetical protein J5851_09630 [Oscillospiraceae bacterium]|nr:hypothetical protein [Oscillospiraceae bacterium]
MSDADLIGMLIPSVFCIIWGIAQIIVSRKRKNELETCTEMVTATIDDASKIRRRYGYNYYYMLRYVWMDEVYKVQIKTLEPFGATGEETVIHIDPDRPKKIRLPESKAMSFGWLVMGIAILVVGFVWAVGAIGYYLMMG